MRIRLDYMFALVAALCLCATADAGKRKRSSLQRGACVGGSCASLVAPPTVRTPPATPTTYLERFGMVEYADRESVAADIRKRWAKWEPVVTEGRITHDRTGEPISVWMYVRLNVTNGAPAELPLLATVQRPSGQHWSGKSVAVPRKTVVKETVKVKP